MNRLRTIAAASTGLLAYGLMHIPPAPEEIAIERNAAVQECASNIGEGDMYVAELSVECKRFESYFKDQFIWPNIDPSDPTWETASFYIPPQEQFIHDNFKYPEDIAKAETLGTAENILVGLSIGGLAYGVFGVRIRREEKADRSHEPKQIINEDSPEWMEYAWGRKA